MHNDVSPYKVQVRNIGGNTSTEALAVKVYYVLRKFDGLQSFSWQAVLVRAGVSTLALLIDFQSLKK